MVARFMERDVQVINRLGLHARPAAEFVRCVQTFQSRIMLIKDGETFSAASILDVLSANLDHGATMTLDADGPDAEAALERLAQLMHELSKHDE